MRTERVPVSAKPLRDQADLSLTRRQVLQGALLEAGALCATGVLAACGRQSQIPTGSSRIDTSAFDYRPVSARTRFCSPNCFWYKPLPTTPTGNWRLGYYEGRTSLTAWYGYPVNLQSYHGQYTEAFLVSELTRQMATFKGWINTVQYSDKIYTVPANFPTQHLQIWQNGAYQTWCPGLNAAFANTPWPLQELTPSGTLVNTSPAPGYDGGTSVYSASLDTLWQTNYDSYVASQYNYPYGPFWGGVFFSASQLKGVTPTNTVIPGYGTFNPRSPSEAWGSSASGMMIECGIMKWNDWVTNHAFNHAIYFQTVDGQPMHTYPAYKGDGPAAPTKGNQLPHGTMFRFDPTMDLSPTDSYGSCSRFGLQPFAAAMARAIQTYGMISGDGAGAIGFVCENVDTDTWNPGPNNDWYQGTGSGVGIGFGYGGGTNNPGTIINNQLLSPTMLSHLMVVDPKWLFDQGLGEASTDPYY